MPELSIPETITEINLGVRTKGYPSPETWRDQVLYFLLPDRFSDGGELQRPLFDRNNPNQYKALDKGAWMSSGTRFQGGTIKGITSKLDYLRGLGITALWIGPLFKQRMDLQTYHGYAIQNFLDVDPRFGTVDDLKELVSEAHNRGMYIILDAIYNHTGDNWFYNENGEIRESVDYRFQPPHDFGAWRAADGNASSTINSRDDGVWPKEFQNQDYYTRAGKIGNWDPQSWEDPIHKDAEFRRGDFFDLKDLNYDNSEVTRNIIQLYQYWIEVTDCDGFRIDAENMFHGMFRRCFATQFMNMPNLSEKKTFYW